MACDITSGIARDCRSNLGGVQYFYVTSDAIGDITESAGEITALSGTPTFYKFEVPRNSASFTETGNFSLEADTAFYQQDLAVSFSKMDAAKRNQLSLLGQNTTLFVVYKDENGSFFSVGAERGAYLTASNQQSGQALGDMNGVTMTITATEPNPSFKVDAAVVGE